MGKRKLNSKTKYVSLILVFALVAISCTSILTYAWFTDREDYSSNLTFGKVELDVSGDGVNNTEKTLTFSTTRSVNNDSTWTGNIMPGDTVNINLTISLTSESEDAYYIVQITDDKNIFENAYYYSQNGTDVYVNDGTTIYKQGDATKTAVTTPVVGKLLKGTAGHNITIGAKISEDYTAQSTSTTIECNIFAIQVANLSEADAFDLLNNEAKKTTMTANFIGSWKAAITGYADFGKIGFYKKGSQPTTVTLNSDLTTAYNNAVTNEADKNLIEVYTNGTTQLAFVSEYKIYAPENCQEMFMGVNVREEKSCAWTEIVFDNFYTDNVTNMDYMFRECKNVTRLDLSSFDTSKVVYMNNMFNGCSSLTRLDISSKFTNKGIAFTKATLCETTGLPTSVAVYRDGELLA